MASKRKRKTLTQAEVNEWLRGESEKTGNHVLTFVHKYDNAIMTKQDMVDAIRDELDKAIERVYDQGFEDGVHGSVDVMDEDDPVAFEIEEEDES